jgi:hypothetical protein
VEDEGARGNVCLVTGPDWWMRLGKKWTTALEGYCCRSRRWWTKREEVERSRQRAVRDWTRWMGFTCPFKLSCVFLSFLSFPSCFFSFSFFVRLWMGPLVGEALESERWRGTQVSSLVVVIHVDRMARPGRSQSLSFLYAFVRSFVRFFFL